MLVHNHNCIFIVWLFFLYLMVLKHFVESQQLDKETIFEHGPEPLEDSFTKKVFLERINKYPNKAIKTSLMDQRLISGIGNIYSDEILFAAKILPWWPVKKLTLKQLETIYKHIKPILLKGIN